MLEVKNRIKLIKKKHKLVKRDQAGIPSLGSKSFKRVLLAVFMAYLPLNEIQAHTIGAKTSKLKSEKERRDPTTLMTLQISSSKSTLIMILV